MYEIEIQSGSMSVNIHMKQIECMYNVHNIFSARLHLYLQKRAIKQFIPFLFIQIIAIYDNY